MINENSLSLLFAGSYLHIILFGSIYRFCLFFLVIINAVQYSWNVKWCPLVWDTLY